VDPGDRDIRRKDAYLVSAELPGVSAGEVEISFGDGLLTIQGERHAARDATGERVHRSERCYGAFRRSITLPGYVQAGKIEATAQDGVLRVLVPKAPDVQARRILVRAGQGPRSRPAGRPTGVDNIPVTGCRPGDHDPPAVTAARSGDGRSRP
jgi:HSP20 family protein